MNFITCKCGKSFPAATNTSRIEHSEGVFSIGVRCPHCDDFTHSFYEDSDLTEMRKTTESIGRKRHRSKKHRRAHDAILERFARAFEALQERLK